VKSLQVDREAHDVPFAARVRLATEAEASKAECRFDPPKHRFDNRKASWSAAQWVTPVATIICDAASTAIWPL
jgi:hypothetical protein